MKDSHRVGFLQVRMLCNSHQWLLAWDLGSLHRVTNNFLWRHQICKTSKTCIKSPLEHRCHSNNRCNSTHIICLSPRPLISNLSLKTSNLIPNHTLWCFSTQHSQDSTILWMCQQLSPKTRVSSSNRMLTQEVNSNNNRKSLLTIIKNKITIR